MAADTPTTPVPGGEGLAIAPSILDLWDAWRRLPPEARAEGLAFTRRAALKGAASTLAASGATGLVPAAEDPALVAIAEWERAWLAEWGKDGALELFGEGSPEEVAADAAEEAAHNAVCQTVATTAAGLAAQLRFAYRVFGEAWSIDAPGYRAHEPYSDPEAYTFGDWENGRDATLLASLLAGAQGLASGGAE